MCGRFLLEILRYFSTLRVGPISEYWLLSLLEGGLKVLPTTILNIFQMHFLINCLSVIKERPCCKTILEKISRSTFIVSPCFYRRNLPELMSRLGSAFEVDLLLKRTFLRAIPVGELNKVVASKLFQIFDILAALVTCCSHEYLTSAKVRNCLERVNKVLFHNSRIFFWYCICSSVLAMYYDRHLIVRKVINRLPNVEMLTCSCFRFAVGRCFSVCKTDDYSV